VVIYDDKGRKEFVLVENQILGSQGFFKWDGNIGNNTLAPVGMYIIHYKFFHPEGDVMSGKKVCVLAQQLN